MTLEQRFLTDTDESGRFIVHSQTTGVKYFVEPIGNPRTGWGSFNPSTGNIENKKGSGKYKGSIDETESMITSEAGFQNIETLGIGVSPLNEIYRRDLEYETKIN